MNKGTDIHPLNYATPASASIRRLFSIPIGLSVAIVTVLIFIFLGITPTFEQIFKDFKTELPGTTKLLLAISRWFMNDYGWALVLLIAAPGTVVGLSWLIGDKLNVKTPSRREFTRCLSVFVLCFVVFIVFAV